MLEEGKDFYYNENGLFVFTEAYLKNRGFCCSQACKHCPYRKKLIRIKDQVSKD